MKPENLLKPLTAGCKTNKCQHKKCTCGHCGQYHIGAKWECCKIDLDLTTCNCKILELN